MSTKGADYRVALFDPAHRAAVIDLQRHLWSPDPDLNAAYLDWKYLRNPYVPEPLIYLAFDGGELIGMRGAFGSCWEAGSSGERFTLPYPDDFVVLPAYEGKWLQQRIMGFAFEDLAKRGFRHVVNLSASRATALGSMRMKWRSAGGVGAIHRRTRRERLAGRLAARVEKLKLLWRWADRIPGLLLPSGDPFARLDRRSARGITVRRAPLAREMAELVRSLPWDGRIRHVRDEEFLGWRYQNPLHEYRFIFAGGDRLEGYLVLQRLVRPGHRRICIADWEARDQRVFGALLDAAIGGGFTHLHAWSAGVAPGRAEVLARNGFETAEEFETSILARATRDEDMKGPWMLADRRLDAAADWDVRMIYSARG